MLTQELYQCFGDPSVGEVFNFWDPPGPCKPRATSETQFVSYSVPFHLENLSILANSFLLGMYSLPQGGRDSDRRANKPKINIGLKYKQMIGTF